MAFLYITEYQRQARDAAGALIPAGQEPAVTTQKIAIGASSVQSLAFGPSTFLVRIHTDAICSVKFGQNPTATAGDARMGVDATEFFGVNPSDKVAVIQNT